jgi:hypothetical protein
LPENVEDKSIVGSACGKRGADVRPNFDWDKPGALSAVVYRQKNLARHLRRAKSWEECRKSFAAPKA